MTTAVDASQIAGPTARTSGTLGPYVQVGIVSLLLLLLLLLTLHRISYLIIVNLDPVEKIEVKMWKC